MRFLALLLPLLAACGGPARDATSRQAAGPPACRPEDSVATAVLRFLARVDTAGDGAPQMRQAAGRQGVGRLQPIRLLDDEAVCRRAAAAYAEVLGPDSGGVGVHVFRYGKAYVVNRPDRTANSILLVVDEAFKRIDMWGF